MEVYIGPSEDCRASKPKKKQNATSVPTKLAYQLHNHG